MRLSGISRRVVRLHQQAGWHGEVAHLGGEAHVAHHRAADEAHLPPVRRRRVEHLLHPVHVAGEAGDDDPRARPVEHAVEHRPDLALGDHEPGLVGVGGIDEEQVDALVAQPGEPGEVGEPTVEGQLVELDVAGVQHQARGRADGDGQRVRDGVVDREVLAVPAAVPQPTALLHLQQVRGEAVLPALGGDERQREAGADDGEVRALPQQERHRADVVFVAVGEHDRVDVVEAPLDGPEIGQDQVDARRVLGREEHAAVDDEQPPVVLEHRHVAADLADAAERHHAQAAFGQLGWRRGGQLRAVHLLRRRGDGPGLLLAAAGTAIGTFGTRQVGCDPSAREGDGEACGGQIGGDGAHLGVVGRGQGQARLADVEPDQAQRGLGEHHTAHPVHGPRHGQQRGVDLARAGVLARFERRVQRAEAIGDDVPDDAHEARRPHGEPREVHRVVAGVVGEAGAARAPSPRAAGRRGRPSPPRCAGARRGAPTWPPRWRRRCAAGCRRASPGARWRRRRP